jgi:UDP-N-acetyl-D-mannosaminuronate dehydrogenase
VNDREIVLVVGLGEVGRPLHAILSRYHHVVGIDIKPPAEQIESAEVMHVCYPFEIRDFVGKTIRYITRYKPALTIINSTVGVGTTRKVAELTGAAVVHSPVRGKHERMQEEMHYYTKFIGALDAASAQNAARHFKSSGFKTRVLSSPEATELGKLAETTYFGVMIAWAQDLERYCDRTGTDYNEVISLYDEIGFFPPVRYFPGIIGRHCVMPNIKLLGEVGRSFLLKAIEASNELKIEREARKQAEDVNKHHPFAATTKH